MKRVDGDRRIRALCTISIFLVPALGVLPSSARAQSMGGVMQAGLWVASSGWAGFQPCTSDLNDDGVVGPADLAQVLGAWGPNPGNPADLNADGTVGPADLAQVLGAWGPCLPANDDCENRTPIEDGQTPFSTLGATTDGISHEDQGCQYDGQVYNDIWYNYTATCTGTLTVSTCNQADYDTDLAVYDGCACDPFTLLGCNDDDLIDDCGQNPDFHSTVLAPVVQDGCYKIRVGGYLAPDEGSGVLTVACVAGGPCPGQGGCCEANGTPGCDDPACCSLVCGADPFCCDVSWDEVCAESAIGVCAGLCGDGSSDCCEPHATLGCDDAGCAQEVCEVAPFCCAGPWDELCVQLAAALCPGACP